MYKARKRLTAMTFGMIVVILALMAALNANASGESGNYAQVSENGICWQYFEDVSAYREEGNLIAPEPANENGLLAGYVFSGWYQEGASGESGSYEENNGKVPCNIDLKTGGAWAKFVPKEVLSVKAQVSANLLESEQKDTGAIRFVTTVDSNKYQKVGFYFTYNEATDRKSRDCSSNTIYTELHEVSKVGVEYVDHTKLPSDFHPLSKAFKAWTWLNVSKESFDMGFTVTPYWVTIDGTVVTGMTEVRTINQGIECYTTPDEPKELVIKNGYNYYTSLGRAITVANQAEEDVTVELLANVSAGTVTIKNDNNKNLTINGNGYQLKSTADFLFSVTQTEGTLNFHNMTVIHNGKNAFVRTRTEDANDTIAQNLTLNFKDTKIYAENDKSGYYPWGVFNFADSGTVNLNLVRTSIRMKIGTATGGNKYSAIRVCDVAGQTANITMADSSINTVEAEQRAGISACGATNTKANITLVRSKIETKNQYPIYIYGTAGKTTCNIYKDDSAVLNVSENQNMSNSPIKADAAGNLNTQSASAYVAQCGGIAYKDFKNAIKAAKSDTVIYMLGNVDFTNIDITDEYSNNIMINGLGYQLTTSSNANTFQLMQIAGSFSLCDMTVIHNGTNQFIRTRTKDGNDGISQDITVNLTDVKLYAENDQTDAYKYGLINLADQGSVNLNLTRTRMNMKRSAATGGDKYSIIRVDRSEGKQEVDIVMKDSIIDAGEAEGRSGIAVTGKSDTTAKITLKNTTIETKNQYPIYVYGMDATCKVTVLKDSACQFKVKENEGMEVSPIYAAAPNNLAIIDMEEAN